MIITCKGTLKMTLTKICQLLREKTLMVAVLYFIKTIRARRHQQENEREADDAQRNER